MCPVIDIQKLLKKKKNTRIQPHLKSTISTLVSTTIISPPDDSIRFNCFFFFFFRMYQPTIYSPNSSQNDLIKAVVTYVNSFS